VGLYKSRPFKKHARCKFPWTSVCITSNGDVVQHPRCFYKIFGNVKNNSLKEIWNNEEYRKFRRVMKENKGILPGCNRCCGIM